MAAKRRSLRLPKVLFSPLKTSGFCSAKPKKKERICAQISRKVRSWWNFTTPLEPILRKNARKFKAQTECAPPAQTFAYFLRFPRRISFLNLKKVWSGGSPENTLFSVFSERTARPDFFQIQKRNSAGEISKNMQKPGRAGRLRLRLEFSSIFPQNRF